MKEKKKSTAYCSGGCTHGHGLSLCFVNIHSVGLWDSSDPKGTKRFNICNSVAFASIDNLSSEQEKLTEDKTPPEGPLLEDSQIECALSCPSERSHQLL